MNPLRCFRKAPALTLFVVPAVLAGQTDFDGRGIRTKTYGLASDVADHGDENGATPPSAIASGPSPA